jgi:hypothetical protein
MQMFNNLPVEPLTIKQNTPEWFLLCAFLCTSSTSDQLLNELKDTVLDPNSTVLIEEMTAAALKTVFDFVHGPRWDAIREAPVEIVPPLLQEENILENEPVDEDGQIQLHFSLLMSGSTTLAEEQIKYQVANNSITNTLIWKYLEKN